MQPDLQEQMEQRELKVRKVLLEPQGLLVLLDPLALREPQGPREPMEKTH